MKPWSDGRVRTDRYEGSDLYRAIRKFFGERNEELRLDLLWENEMLRDELRRRNQPQVKVATA